MWWCRCPSLGGDSGCGATTSRRCWPERWGGCSACPWPRAGLARRRDTPPQARSVDAEARRRNVAGAFVGERRRVEGRHVLLVDDVMTTGATLDACAQALHQAGAASVWALTFARED